MRNVNGAAARRRPAVSLRDARISTRVRRDYPTPVSSLSVEVMMVTGFVQWHARRCTSRADVQTVRSWYFPAREPLDSGPRGHYE